MNKSAVGILGAIWGIAGILILLGTALYRLTPIFLESLSHNLAWYHWTAMALNIVLMAHSEGYKGFQKGFSPRVAARAKYLTTNPKILLVLFAPLFCMGYIYSTRKRKIVVISLTVMILAFIFLIRSLEQPWRGIADSGVVVGLTWGTISLIVFCIQGFVSSKFVHSPEIP